MVLVPRGSSAPCHTTLDSPYGRSHPQARHGGTKSALSSLRTPAVLWHQSGARQLLPKPPSLFFVALGGYRGFFKRPAAYTQGGVRFPDSSWPCKPSHPASHLKRLAMLLERQVGLVFSSWIGSHLSSRVPFLAGGGPGLPVAQLRPCARSPCGAA